jgi:hypothetical protein
MYLPLEPSAGSFIMQSPLPGTQLLLGLVVPVDVEVETDTDAVAITELLLTDADIVAEFDTGTETELDANNVLEVETDTVVELNIDPVADVEGIKLVCSGVEKREVETSDEVEGYNPLDDTERLEGIKLLDK